MTTPLDTFETALLGRLREHVEPEPKAVDRPARPLWSRPRILLVGAATVAAATAMVVVLPGLGTTPAYSVQEGNSGTITVEVNRLEDAAGLENDLADVGIDADITYLPDSQQCAPGRYEPVARSTSGLSVEMGSDLLKVTLPPGTLRQGETFVMAVSGEDVAAWSAQPDQDEVVDLGGFSGYSDFGVTAGPVSPCQPVADPNR